MSVRERGSDVAVSIIVVAYRQRGLLAECLDACTLAAAQVPGGAELIVVDNGGLASFVHACSGSATVLQPGKNIGFAGGVNRGVETARGRWVALVNDDARLEPTALMFALQAGERDPRIGAVATQVRFHSDPGVINSAGIDVDSLGVASERLAGRVLAMAQEPAEVFGASGCFALYRRAMMHELAALDERFFAYLEDVDLAWRAQAAGWRAIYEPRAICYHHASASSGEGSDLKYFLVGRNRVRLLALNATTRLLLRALPGILLYDLAYVAYVGAFERTLAPLRGRAAGLRAWRTLRRESAHRRREVKLRSPLQGWLEALRMHRAYRQLHVRGD